ncbi:MAG TPA: hypothetical protein VMT22_07460, partial [Terriglobales bacterium]|nr:hypothetical protein [Terriglobales bacterium]
MLSPGQTVFLKNTWLVRAFQEIHANLFFPAVFWHRALKTTSVSAFSGPPRGNSVIDRGPLGFA